MSLLAALADDLAAENAALDAVLATVDGSAPTPAEGWTVRDTVAHLHASDRAALAALSGGDLWAAFAADPVGPWRPDRDAVIAAAAARPADAGKIPWFGPPMSAASFLTARLMETWAHGVDIRDAAGAETVFTERLRHIADLGVRTRGWSYAVRGLTPPDVPVHVALTTPGETWTWGPAEAAQTVRGSALDFCLLVVQRRPPASLDVRAVGADARRWLEIAQAFAGQPTGHRDPARQTGRGQP